MSASRLSSRWSRFAKIAAGFGVSAFCLWWSAREMLGNPEESLPRIARAFQTANYWLLLPTWFALALFYWLKAWRWRLLLAPLGRFDPARELVPPTMIGFAFNNLLPAHLGDFVRVFVFARRHRLPKAAVLSTVILERVFDVLAIVSFFGLGLFFVTGLDPLLKRTALIGGAAAAAMTLGAAAFVAWTDPFVRLAESILTRLPFVPPGLRAKFFELLESGARGLSALHQPALLIGIVALSLAQWALNGWMMHLALVSCGVQVSLWVACVLLGAVAFAVTVPSSPGYVGVIQLCFMSVLKLFTDDKEAVFAASVLYHLAQYIPVTLIGLYYFGRTGLKVSDVRQQAESEAETPPVPAPEFPAG
ncbi:MAG: flippase-like domain-containing protein [Planctomyces sp.]|nr:flippase-like domain-containing protein [Planctomyces sp.]